MRAINNPGGFVWTGSLAKWAATIPIDFSGLHSGLFNGEYVPKGDGGKRIEPRTFTWQVDTNATVLVIQQESELWWFDGEDPESSACKISSRFTLSGGDVRTTWRISQGANKVKFISESREQTATTASTGQSERVGDVSIIAIHNGSEIEIKTQVYAPDTARFDFTRSFTKKHDKWTYSSSLSYVLYDQFARKMDVILPVNEKFTTVAKKDYEGTNWEQPTAGGAEMNLGIEDVVDGSSSAGWIIPLPTLTKPDNRTKVIHWNGEWRVGSRKVGKGKIIRSADWAKPYGYSEICVWQKHRGFATHNFAEDWMENVR